MRRLLHALAASAALLAAACGKSDCQLMQERLCSCTGATSDECQSQAESLIKNLNPSQSVQDKCGQLLGSCNPPSGAELCEWLHSANGQVACGLALEPVAPTTTTP
jgi:hypothetical protein